MCVVCHVGFWVMICTYLMGAGVSDMVTSFYFHIVELCVLCNEKGFLSHWFYRMVGSSWSQRFEGFCLVYGVC